MSYLSKLLPAILALVLATACSRNPAPELTSSPTTKPESSAILKAGDEHELTR